MATYTAAQIDAAIEAEARAWAEFFHVEATNENLEGRRMVMRANVAQNYFAPLREFLPTSDLFAAGEVVSMREYAKRLAHR